MGTGQVRTGDHKTEAERLVRQPKTGVAAPKMDNNTVREGAQRSEDSKATASLQPNGSINIEMKGKVYFDFDKSRLQSGGGTVAQHVAEEAEKFRTSGKFSSVTITIQAGADKVQGRAPNYNMHLSERRGNTIKDHIKPSFNGSIKVVPLGDREATVPASATHAQREVDRKGVLVITTNPPMTKEQQAQFLGQLAGTGMIVHGADNAAAVGAGSMNGLWARAGDSSGAVEVGQTNRAAVSGEGLYAQGLAGAPQVAMHAQSPRNATVMIDNDHVTARDPLLKQITYQGRGETPTPEANDLRFLQGSKLTFNEQTGGISTLSYTNVNSSNIAKHRTPGTYLEQVTERYEDGNAPRVVLIERNNSDGKAVKALVYYTTWAQRKAEQGN